MCQRSLIFPPYYNIERAHFGPAAIDIDQFSILDYRTKQMKAKSLNPNIIRATLTLQLSTIYFLVPFPDSRSAAPLRGLNHSNITL